MRGKGRAGAVRTCYDRITPAYAGKRMPPTVLLLLRWDHPRVCGEKSKYLSAISAVLGSPPRMRGKGPLHFLAPSSIGITPAYAGKRHLRKEKRNNERDHPRVCGEKSFQICFALSMMGSPPRMRGKATRPHAKPRQSRITPAYAGKSFCVRCVEVRCGDHPRVCGEKTKKIS